MGRLHPYLQRRGNRFFFRIAVPAALRELVGVREFTAALRTGERSVAVPLALELGATAHRLFQDLVTDKEKLLKVLADARVKLRLDEVRAEMRAEVEHAHRLRIAAVHQAKQDAERTAREMALAARAQALEEAIAAFGANARLPRPEPDPVGKTSPASSPTLLSTVIDDFLADYAKDKKPAMFKKQKPALELLRELVGAKSIDQLKQRDLADYFSVLQGLPPRWAEKCKKRGMTARDLAAQDHPELLGKKTFDDNYEVPIRLFIKWAKFNYLDAGFPGAWTTDGVEFRGEDDEGQNKQRAFTQSELEQLFRGLAHARLDDGLAHMWWLPVLGLYTGARINELCQLNPQTDIGASPDGIYFLRLTEETEGDDGLRKSIKTRVERLVPLHPEVVEGGFLKYVDHVRLSGARRLFPAWRPVNGRASTQAERWFRDWLQSTGLRDDTPGRRLVGFHAFRHTLLTSAANSLPPVDAGPITGHADKTKSKVQRDYEGELPLPHKLERLVAIQFPVNPCR